MVSSLLPEAPTVFPVIDPSFQAHLESLWDTWLPLRGIPALKFMWDEFILPVGRHMHPKVASALSEYEPDVAVCDQQAIGGAVAARQHGTLWATSAAMSSEFSRPLADLPKVEQWILDGMFDFQQRVGVAPVDLRFSDRLVLSYTTPELLGSPEVFPDHYVFTGPAITPRPERSDFPWDRLDPDRKRVLVHLGTLNAGLGDRFFATAIEGLADKVQLIIAASSEMVPNPPEGVIVRDYVPQLELLPHLDAVLCHGGHNTVVESLAHGVPLVIAPIRDDQPIHAQQVAQAGAGLRIRFGRLSARELSEAVMRVIEEPSFRAAAGSIRQSFERAGGAAHAAEALEELVRVNSTSERTPNG
jgi:MGT family glycosyltransferase